MAAKILPDMRQGVELRANISHESYRVKPNRQFPQTAPRTPSAGEEIPAGIPPGWRRGKQAPPGGHGCVIGLTGKLCQIGQLRPKSDPARADLSD